ncbi:MAG: PRC-barrel domain containing protein [Geminicoccaceae bacterium]|nr:MAG: PRC-barrel domain containing protein [Geminicoccaceae bacterium]
MRKTLLASTAVVLLAVPSWAQAEEPPRAGAAGEFAEQCMQDLRLFSQRMVDEGYWFTGYRGTWGWHGWGAGVDTPPGVLPPADPAARAPAPRDPVGAQPGMMPPTPWAVAGWATSPGHEILSLQNAAMVLARHGDEAGCQFVLERTEAIYDHYAGQLRAAGVEPGEISAWRQEQIAAAQPVREVEHIFSFEHITGTEIRNLQDEHIGNVDDLVWHPETGEISFAIVGHGGFLGFGQSYAAVPWEMFMATPGFETLLMDAPAAAIEDAPEVTAEELTGRDAFTAASDRIRDYWAGYDQS